MFQPLPGDLPPDQLRKLADQTIQKYLQEGIDAVIYFKFTCEACGERCILQDANTLYENGECVKCQHVTRIERGGFMLAMRLE